MKLNQELHRLRPEMDGRTYIVAHQCSEQYPGIPDPYKPGIAPIPIFRSRSEYLAEFDCYVDAHHYRKQINHQLKMTTRLSNFNRVIIRGADL